MLWDCAQDRLNFREGSRPTLDDAGIEAQILSVSFILRMTPLQQEWRKQATHSSQWIQISREKH